MTRRLLFALLAGLMALPAIALTTGGPTAQAGLDLAIGGPVTYMGHIGDANMVNGRIVEGENALGQPTRFLVTHGTDGISVYDIAIPERPVLAGYLPVPHFYSEDMDLGGDVLIVALDPAWVTNAAGGLYIVDISNLPQMSLHYINPLTGNLWKEPGRATGGGGHTVSCIRADCSWAYVNGTGTIGVLDLRDPKSPKVAGTFPAAMGDTHDIQVDEHGYAWMVGTGGIVALDTTDPLAPVQVTNMHKGGLNYHHNSLRPDGGDTVLVTEEAVYPALEHTACGSNASFGDGQGRFQTRRITGGDATVGTGAKESLETLDTWATELQVAGLAGKGLFWCSAHYFDESDGIVAIGWYEQGTRFLDVSDPSNIEQVGYFVPADSESWDTKWVGPGALGGEIVYVFDFNRGIDILRFDRDQPLLPVEAPILQHWLVERPEVDAPQTRAWMSAGGTSTVMCRIPGAALAT